MGLIEDDDIRAVTRLPEVPEEEGNKDGDVMMPLGYNSITVKIVADDTATA